MGLTQKLGTIPLAIFTDASNNIGIGGSPSGSYKFEVTGTARVSGVATFSSTAQNAFLINSTNTDGPILQIQNSGNNLGLIGNAEGITNGGVTNFAIRATNNLIFSTGGANPRMTITSGGNVGIGTSSPLALLDVCVLSSGARRLLVNYADSIVTIKSANDSNNGENLRLVGDNVIFNSGSSGNGSERMRITSDGRLLINQSSGATNVKVKIRVSDQSSSNYALLIDNSVTDLLQIRNDGAMYIGLATASPYNLTTGAAANAVVASDGYLARSTSSLKYKKNVKDYDKGLNDVLQLRTVYYESINQKEDGIQYAGFIAEEVHELGLTEFVQYAEDGSPDALAYQNMVSLLVKAIQEQNQLISELSAKVSALENK